MPAYYFDYAMHRLRDAIDFAEAEGDFISIRKWANEVEKAHSNEMPADVVEDGFGNSASVICSQCGGRSVYVNRPGEFRCQKCDDNERPTNDMPETLPTSSQFEPRGETVSQGDMAQAHPPAPQGL